jgi:hypothetical protein
MATYGSNRSPIDATESDAAFVERYALSLDGRRLDLSDRYKHMRAVYEDEHPVQVIMAGSQTSKSARVMVRQLRLGIQRWGASFAYYFPDYFLPRTFSRNRFKPLVQSSPELRPWLGASSEQGQGSDAVLIRSFGPSSFFFLSVGGKTSTEGNPFQGIFFDEVRRMSPGDVMRATERISAQEDPIDFKVSTARYPEADIHAFFLAGDQRFFHTDCKCPDGVSLTLTYPDCIADLRHATPELLRKVEHAYSHAGVPYLGMDERQREEFPPACYLCPTCGTVLTDPRSGWWHPHNPKVFPHSYQLSQMHLWTYPAGRILLKGERPEDVQELWNSMVGMPFIDKQAQPVQPEDLEACVDRSLVWPALQGEDWIRHHCKNLAMGADTMGGYNCVVLKEVGRGGKHRTVHLEILHGDDPWEQMARLMVLFDVRIAVIDQLPHYNEAHRFAKQFPGRVFLASYSEQAGTEGGGKFISWGDRARDPSDQKGGREIKSKHTVAINKTKGLHWSLRRWAERLNECPDPDQLIQQLPKQTGRVVLTAGLAVGSWEPTRICREVYWLHLQRVAFQKVYTSEDAHRRGQFRVVAENVGLDPHFANADLYANVALARIGRPAGPRQV